MKISKKLRQRRRELDITQAELADLIGVHRVRISEWERGEMRGIEAKNIVALEKALHFLPGELFKAYYA